jgi:hypothetical protein
VVRWPGQHRLLDSASKELEETALLILDYPATRCSSRAAAVISPAAADAHAAFLASGEAPPVGVEGRIVLCCDMSNALGEARHNLHVGDAVGAWPGHVTTDSVRPLVGPSDEPLAWRHLEPVSAGPRHGKEFPDDGQSGRDAISRRKPARLLLVLGVVAFVFVLCV